MDELITIIIPIYQVQKYIEKCLNSVLEQTYKNIEIILVDDGSTDKCPEICEEYARKDNRIKVIHKKNGGLSDARNAGMKIATGKYIGFVDSDDYIEKDMYEILYNNLIKTNSDISICNLKNVKENETIEKLENNNENIIEYSKQEALKLLIENKIRSYAWNKLYKKEILDNIQFPVGRKMEDLAVMHKIFEKANKIVYTNKVEYYYLQREDSILGNIDLKLTKDLLYFVTERYKYMMKKYPELKDVLNTDRVKYILIYHKNICLLNDVITYNEKEFLDEYTFFFFYFRQYKKNIFFDISIMSKFEYNLLYFNRTLFLYYYKLKRLIKKIVKNK
mgnify:CR=1 FL=1